MRQGAKPENFLQNMDILLQILLATLNFINMALHTFGFLLLCCVKQKGSQLIFLLNLSISEFLKNFVLSLKTLQQLLSNSKNSLILIEEIHIYVGIVYDYSIMFSYYMTMFAITADRYFIILLGKRYQNYWSTIRTKYLLVITWILGILTSLTISLAYKFMGDHKEIRYFINAPDREAAVVVYSSPLIDAIFIVLAIAVYYKIFRKYTRSQQKLSNDAIHRQRESAFQLFVQSKFFIAVLLISSFLMFTIIPDMIFSYYQISDKPISSKLDTICYILFVTSDLADVFIYVFVQVKVRKILWKKINGLSLRCKCSRNEEVERLNLHSSEPNKRAHCPKGYRYSTYL